MKLDPHHQKQKLGEHVPGFQGYGGRNALETDLLLRRYLAAELGKVRDRLAELIAAGGSGGGLRERFGETLRSLAALKEEIHPGTSPEPGILRPGVIMEERLLELDLLLLDKVAALHTPLDEMELTGQEAALESSLGRLVEGIAEMGELFRRRREVLFLPADS